MFKLRCNWLTNEIAYQTLEAAGFDIRTKEPLLLKPGKIQTVKTGIFVEGLTDEGLDYLSYGLIPEIQIRPRSSLAAKYGITVVNTPGTVDADYRGEIMVILGNFGDIPVPLYVGDRIAQGVCNIVTRVALPVLSVLRENTTIQDNTKQVNPLYLKR